MQSIIAKSNKQIKFIFLQLWSNPLNIVNLQYKMQQLNLNSKFDSNYFSQLLFQAQLSIAQIGQYKKLTTQQLIEAVRKAAQIFHKLISKKKKKSLLFLSNYHQVVNSYRFHDQHSLGNDFSLHLILLSSFSLIKNNQVQSAKRILKRTEDYIQTGANKALIGVALNNLSFLYLKTNKIYKALGTAMKLIQIMGEQLYELKKQGKRSQIVQDSVVLISGLIVCQKSLKKITKQNKKSFYKELMNYVNKIGHKCSKKYLGKESQFTKFFVLDYDQIQLPIFYEPSVEKSIIQQKILNQLDNIYNFIHNKKPQVVFISEPKIIESKQQSLIVEQQPEKKPQVQSQVQPQIAQQVEVTYKKKFIINKWQVNIQITRQKDLQNNENSGPYQVGNLVFTCKKQAFKTYTMIVKERLKMLLSLLNFRDNMPNQIFLNQTNDQQFVNRFIYPFLDVDDQGNLQIHPKSKTITKLLELKFFKQNVFVFLCHVRFSYYRLSICPINSTNSLYLDIELNKIDNSHLIQCQQESFAPLVSIYKDLAMQGQEFFEYPQVKQQSFKVKEPELLQQKIKKIMQYFQHFLSEQAQDDQLNLQIYLQSNEPQNRFYKYAETNAEKAKLYMVKYLPNIDAIQVFCRNCFKTYDPEGQSYAKGTIMIYQHQFQNNFGIALKESISVFQSFAQILTKAYELQIFQKPLRGKDLDFYTQNALVQHSFTYKSHRRSIIKDQHNYAIPLTIQTITIKNQLPIALRVGILFPIQGQEQFIFIHLVPQMWKKIRKQLDLKQIQKQKEKQEQKQFMIQHVQKFKFSNDFFVVEWLDIVGYQLILSQIQLKNKRISINNQNKWIRLEPFIERTMAKIISQKQK